jgi:hypothetical protein
MYITRVIVGNTEITGCITRVACLLTKRAPLVMMLRMGILQRANVAQRPSYKIYGFLRLLTQTALRCKQEVISDAFGGSPRHLRGDPLRAQNAFIVSEAMTCTGRFFYCS